MRICFIARDHSELNVGGVSTYIADTSRELARRGHEVHVICPTEKESSDSKEQGVFVHKVKLGSMRALSYLLRDILHLKGLGDSVSRFANLTLFNIRMYRRYVRISKRIDITEAEDGAGTGLLPAMRGKPPLVTKFHTPWAVWAKLDNMWRGTMFFRFLKSIERKQFEKSFALNANSHAMAKRIREEYGIESKDRNIDIIYYGMDIEGLKRLAASKPRPVEGRYMLYFGRLEERKGCRTLARALPEILSKVKDVKVIFIGKEKESEGKPQKKHIMESGGKFRDRIFFFDRMERKDLMPIVRHASVVVLPSYWEAFGYTCLESMALGRIVVASSGSGFEEQIQEDGMNGFLFTPKDHKELAKKAIYSLSMPAADRKAMGERAARRARKFDIRPAVTNLVKYYERIIKER